MNAQFPGIAECFDHFRFLGQVFVFFVLDIAPVDKWLEIGAVFDAVGRVDVDHLHLPGHAFFLQKGVHDDKAVAGDQAVGPFVLMLVKFDFLAAALHAFERRFKEAQLAVSLIAFANALDGANDFVGFDGFVNVNGGSGDIKRGVFLFACPVEPGRQMRIKRIRLARFSGCVAVREACLGVIHPRFVVV